MKGKKTAATLGLVGGLALGVWIGSEMTSGRSASAPEPAAVTAQGPEVPAVTPQPRLNHAGKRVAGTPEKPSRVTRAARSTAPAAITAPASDSAPRLVRTIPVSAPELHERMRPVLARGTKMPLAVEGFTSAEQFATLAHASKNTQVPFILLKHRVLAEGQSLEEAIRASNPDVDAKAEVARARAAAKEDIAAVTTTAALSSSN